MGSSSKESDTDEKDKKKSKAVCLAEAEQKFQLCEHFPKDTYRNTIKGKCRGEATISAGIGTDAKVANANVTFSQDRYNMCVNEAAADRDVELNMCEINKANDTKACIKNS